MLKSMRNAANRSQERRARYRPPGSLGDQTELCQSEPETIEVFADRKRGPSLLDRCFPEDFIVLSGIFEQGKQTLGISARFEDPI